MRLNQYIASTSNLSRRNADEAIKSGRVFVNGQIGVLGQTIETDDNVTLDQRDLVLPKSHTYIMINKPVGIVVSRVHQDKSQTIYDIIPAQYHSLNPVGRLDKDSTGLLIMTDDGQFIQRATHPSFEKEKTYIVTLNRQLSQTDGEKITQGIQLEDGISALIIDQKDDKNITVRLHEGRNRQIRRTFEALDYRIFALDRIKFGPYELGDLKPGSFNVIAGGLL